MICCVTVTKYTYIRGLGMREDGETADVYRSLLQLGEVVGARRRTDTGVAEVTCTAGAV